MEHLDGIEPGLTVVDSRLLLGHASVDLVALDAQGSLVLVAIGFTADEEMLLKAVEAYSWCLEYPDAIRRLYPSVEVSAARPPRLMFVVERLPDAFHRKIKQLGFSEVDCVEFRHLDVSGTPAAYFDTIARLRRRSAVPEFQPAPIARRVSETPTRRTPLNTTRMNGGNTAPVIDIAARTPLPAPRPEVSRIETSSAVLQAGIGAQQSDAVETAETVEAQTESPVFEMQHANADIAEPDPTMADVAADFRQPTVEPAEGIALREAIPAPEPVLGDTATAGSPERRVSFAEIANELLGKAAAGPTEVVVAVDARETAAGANGDSKPEPGAALKRAFASPNLAIGVKPGAPAAKPVPPTAKPMTAAPQPAAPAPTTITPAPKTVPAAPKPGAVAPQKPATAGANPTVAPPTPSGARPAAAPAPATKPTAAETPTPNLPREFEGLKFPNDGVLTRQWMEFLNQMASNK